MRTKFTLLAAALLSCLALVNSVRAQSDSDSASDSANPAQQPSGPQYGLLGQGLFSWDLNVQKYRHDSGAPVGMGTNVGFNLPAADNLDFGIGYGFERASNENWKFTQNSAQLSATGFYKFNHVAPFATVGLGYAWEHESVALGTPVAGPRYDRMVANVGTGVELPVVTDTSVRLGVSRDQSFRRPHANDLDYAVSVAYRVNDVLITDLGADLQNGRNGTHDALTYRAGIQINFE